MKRRTLFIGLIGVLCLGGLVLAAFLYGFSVRTDDGAFATRTIFRIERKIDKILGRPQADERAVARVETTFIPFKGALYHLPDTDYRSGGALTLWGGDLLVMPRSGLVHLFVEGEGLRKTAIRPPESGQGDYAALAKSPDFAHLQHSPDTMRFNDILFVDRPDFRGLIVSYTFFDKARLCYGSRLSRVALGPLRAADAVVAPGDWEVFFETEPCLGFNTDNVALQGIVAGGRMALAPDGRLVFGSGDYEKDGIIAPDIGIMDPATSYGKVLAIDIKTGATEILAVGHRNLQGVAVDAKGEIWTVEHAVRGGDELNHIRKGENHGWPKVSLGTLYSGQPLPVSDVEGRHDGYDRPAYAWLPSAGTSALAAIDDFHPAWDGGLIAGSLSSAEYGQSLYHIRTTGDRVVFVERIELKRRIRYVQQFGKRLAVWLDPTDLLILEQVPRLDPLGDMLARMRREFPEEMVMKIEGVLKGCNQCHSFQQFAHATAPSLNGVVGRTVASTDFPDHSEALRAISGKWDREKLAAYLADPQGFAPGTVMPQTGLKQGPLLDAVLWALENLNTTDDEHLTYN